MYPSIKEYKEAILFAEDNFEQMKNLRPVLDEDGNPVMSSGNFAVVFKMKEEQTGRCYAVKCFLRDQDGRAEAYRMISEELEYVSSTFLTPIKYLDKELFVDTNAGDEKEFPILLMDWVEGETLDKYIRKHLDDQYELSLLAYQFSRLAMWLMPQPFAHGDLKPDNILVKSDGTLVLVDYDGMYVPAMKGQRARELGSPDFRHPSRTETDFDEHIDDFSLASILLSLKAISLQPSLLEEYGAKDGLLFSEKDYRNISKCKLLKDIFLSDNNELNLLYAIFIAAQTQGDLRNVHFHIFALSKPKKDKYHEQTQRTSDTHLHRMTPIDLGLSVKWATCNIGANCPEEFGDYFEWGCLSPQNENKEVRRNTNFDSKYNTADGKKVLCPEDDAATCLLGMPWRMPTMEEITELKEKCEWKESSLNGVQGCRVIGPNGNSIFLPLAGSYDWGRGIPRPYKSGYGAYWSSSSYIHNFVFDNSWHLSIHRGKPDVNHYVRAMVYPIRPVMIEDDDLSTEVKEEDLINAWTDEFGIIYSLDRRRLLKVSKELWEKENWEYNILKGTKVICDNAFCLYEHLYHNGHVSITIPNGVVKIGHAAFKGLSLSNIVIPNSVKEIVGNPFICNKGLVSIKVDKGNNIYDSKNDCNAIIDTHNNILISGCSKTQIPDYIKEIGNDAFKECLELTDIIIPDGIESIGVSSFSGCESLKSIIIPQSVNEIKDKAFEYCEFESIIIPDNVSILGEDVFSGCRLKRIYTSEEVKERIIKRSPEYKKYFDETVSTKYDFSNAYEDELGAKYSNDNRRLLSIPKKLKEYVVKDGTEYICNYAFVGGSKTGLISAAVSMYKVNVESVVLPNSIIGIGKDAFAGCNDISRIIIPGGAKMKFDELLPEYKDKLLEKNEDKNLSTEVTDDDFANAWTDEYGAKYSPDKKRLLKVPHEIMDNSKRLPTILYEYSIKEGTEIICDNAFERCAGLTKIIIPNGVTHIGRYAFIYCQGIESIVLPDSVTLIGQGAFYECIKIKTIDLSNNIKTIGHNAFEACTSLESIIVPDSVTELGNYVFQNCSKLHSVTLPVSLRKVGDASFSACYNLDEIVIPRGVVAIGANAFLQCGRLKKIWFSEYLALIDPSAFIGCKKLEYIFIPDKTFDRFEKLLPEFREILMENVVIDNHEGLRRVFSEKEMKTVSKARIAPGTFTKMVRFLMKDGTTKYIPLIKNSKMAVNMSLDLRKAKLVEFTDEGIYYGFDGYGDYYSKYIIEA